MKLRNWFKFFFAVILIFVLGWAYLIGKIYYYSKIDNAKYADAIVVLGASQWGGVPSPVFQARLDQAFSLYNKKFSNKIILTGGVGDGENISEAESGKNYLLDIGVREEDMFMEAKGRTTKESLDEVFKILKEQKVDSIILVSDGFHMMRLNKMADDLGIKSYMSPVKNGLINKNTFVQFKYYVRESWVYVLYLILNI